jgi:hypothetical protein
MREYRAGARWVTGRLASERTRTTFERMSKKPPLPRSKPPRFHESSTETERRGRSWLDADDRRRLPRYLAGIAVFAGGVAWFTLAPSTLSYWVGGVVCSLPFLTLVTERGRRRGYTGDDYGPPNNGDSGPWSGPKRRSWPGVLASW